MSVLTNRRGDAVFLCYHSIADEGPAPLTLPPETFARQLHLLARNGFRGGGIDELEALSQGRRNGGRTAFLTFDDGYVDNHAVALPLLREHGMKAIVFVLPPLLDDGGPFAWPEVADSARRFPDVMRSMTWEMVEELVEAGVEIGSHTLTHPVLPTLDDERLHDELADSRRRIVERLGRCDLLAYPFGYWDARVAEAAGRVGYRFAFTMPLAGQAGGEALSIPRLPVDQRDDERRFALKLRTGPRALMLSPRARRVLTAARRSGLVAPAPWSGTHADEREYARSAPSPGASPGLLGAVRDGYLALAGRGVAFTHQPLGSRIDPDGLEGYWCDLRHKATAAMAGDDWFPRAPNGVRVEYPIALAQTALGYWELMLEGADTRRPFLTLVDWLAANAARTPAGLAWLSPVPMPKYGLGDAWPSAMGQGQVISAMLRAHRLTGDERYRETALAALEPLGTDVAQGGVQRPIDGRLVLEEYPAARPCAVLNGWIFALLGVHELATTTGDPAARALFDRSFDGLLGLLPRYDVGWWSLYSLYDHGRPDLAKPFYQRLHPVMLDALALARPEPQLSAMARRWEAQITPPALARNAANKVAFRLWRAWTDRAER